MFGQKSRPVIGMLTGSLVSGNRSRLVDVATFPTSHLESKTPSPKGIRTFDVGGVGLGIVAALEKADDGRSEIPANKALFSWNLGRSNPIPITLCKKSSRNGGSSEHMEGESLEGYSTVTCHVVYCDGRRVNDRSPFRIKTSSIKSNRASVFHISPARFGEDIRVSASNFLSSCHLCQKKLQGKDIYMYRGEKAFCSSECRYRQIVMDERKEKCSSEASRPIDVSSSPYANGQILAICAINILA